ncbi:MAG: tRNA (N(6)-L-threonylcarbamoyladenosine(37)-C(2))-methylthiotransferase MtaB [Synergistaceae bacterium]|nr:tRNA (N(6)-L-threonylcarbamoyladenosine(37)-C(2))-methylthiotransferase MtaB [Synergistaceae bacterium]
MIQLKEKKYSIHIQGCRTNQYEGEAIAALLEKAGATCSFDVPDVSVVVSCTVTGAADSKCRKLIRKLRRESPASLIIACGCYAQNMSSSQREALGVDIVVGNRMKYRIPQLASEWFSNNEKRTGLSVLDDDIMNTDKWDPLLLDRPRLHTRAFLKIQDGCHHFCSYCIIPYVRGKPVSRSMDDALSEAERIVGSGCPEIVLTGVHLGLYEDLPLLVRKIGSIHGLKRLRFGSIEPFAVDDKLLGALAQTETFCPHLHLPLQSGDDGVLSKMRRGYTAEKFRKITDNIRHVLGDKIHLSTDLMVGFPTEDDTAFENSLRFINDISFGKIHVFNYSPRKGTEAALMARPPEKEVKERVKKAHLAADRLLKEYCSKWIGKKVDVLVEDKQENFIKGLTRNYIKSAVFGQDAQIGEEIQVNTERYENGVLFSGIGTNNFSDKDEFPDFL